MNEVEQDWSDFFMELAQKWATRSKDPSTCVGAVIADGKHILSAGYNGFPKGVDDDPALYANREQKYPRVVHAEVNAVIEALKRNPSNDCTMFCTLCPCSRCMGTIINSGIVKYVVIPEMSDDHERWSEDFKITHDLVAKSKKIELMTLADYKKKVANGN